MRLGYIFGAVAITLIPTRFVASVFKRRARKRQSLERRLVFEQLSPRIVMNADPYGSGVDDGPDGGSGYYSGDYGSGYDKYGSGYGSDYQEPDYGGSYGDGPSGSQYGDSNSGGGSSGSSGSGSGGGGSGSSGSGSGGGSYGGGATGASGAGGQSQNAQQATYAQFQADQERGELQPDWISYDAVGRPVVHLSSVIHVGADSQFDLNTLNALTNVNDTQSLITNNQTLDDGSSVIVVDQALVTVVNNSGNYAYTQTASRNVSDPADNQATHRIAYTADISRNSGVTTLVLNVTAEYGTHKLNSQEDLTEFDYSSAMSFVYSFTIDASGITTLNDLDGTYDLTYRYDTGLYTFVDDNTEAEGYHTVGTSQYFYLTETSIIYAAALITRSDRTEERSQYNAAGTYLLDGMSGQFSSSEDSLYQSATDTTQTPSNNDPLVWLASGTSSWTQEDHYADTDQWTGTYTSNALAATITGNSTGVISSQYNSFESESMMLVIGELPVVEDFDGDDSSDPNYAYRPAPGNTNAGTTSAAILQASGYDDRVWQTVAYHLDSQSGNSEQSIYQAGGTFDPLTAEEEDPQTEGTASEAGNINNLQHETFILDYANEQWTASGTAAQTKLGSSQTQSHYRGAATLPGDDEESQGLQIASWQDITESYNADIVINELFTLEDGWSAKAGSRYLETTSSTIVSGQTISGQTSLGDMAGQFNNTDIQTSLYATDTNWNISTNEELQVIIADSTQDYQTQSTYTQTLAGEFSDEDAPVIEVKINGVTFDNFTSNSSSHYRVVSSGLGYNPQATLGESDLITHVGSYTSQEDSTSNTGRTAQGEYERVVEDTTYTGSYDLSASSITVQNSNTALLLEDNVWQLVWPNAAQSDATAERSPTLDTSGKNQRVTTGNNGYRFEYWANGIVSPNEELESQWTGVASESGSIRYDTTMHMSGAVLLTPPSEQESEQDNAPESNDDFFADPNAVADLPDSVWPSALRSGTTTQNELLAFVNMRNVFKALDGDVSGSVHVNVQYNYDKAKAIDQALADGDWNAIAGSIATDDVLDVDVIVNGSKVLDEGELTGTLHFGQVTQIDKITDRDDTWDANAQLWNSVGTKSEQTISNGSSNVILHGSQPGSAGKASVIMQIDISNVTGNNSGEGKTEELKLKPSAAQPSLQALPGMSSSQTLLGFPDTGLDRFDWQQTAGGSGKASSSLMTYTAQGSGTYQGDDMSGSGTVSNTVTTATSTAQANIFLPTTGGSNSTSTRSVSTSVNNVITSQGQGFYTYDVGGGSVSGTKLESTLNNVVIDRWEVTSTPVSGSTTASTQSERQAIVNSLKLIPIIGQSSNEPTWQDAIEAAITTATGGESSLLVQTTDSSSFSGFGTFTAALNGSGSGSIAENGSNSLTSNFNTASAVDSAGAWQLVSGNQDVRTANSNAYTQTFAGNWSTNDGIYNMQGTTDWLKSNDSQNSDSTFRQLIDGDWQSTRTSSYSTSSTDNNNQRGSGTYNDTTSSIPRQGTASVANLNSSNTAQSLTRLYQDGVQIVVFGSGHDQTSSSNEWSMQGGGSLVAHEDTGWVVFETDNTLLRYRQVSNDELKVLDSSLVKTSASDQTSYGVVDGSLRPIARISESGHESKSSSETTRTVASKYDSTFLSKAANVTDTIDLADSFKTTNKIGSSAISTSKTIQNFDGSQPIVVSGSASIQTDDRDSIVKHDLESTTYFGFYDDAWEIDYVSEHYIINTEDIRQILNKIQQGLASAGDSGDGGQTGDDGDTSNLDGSGDNSGGEQSGDEQIASSTNVTTEKFDGHVDGHEKRDHKTVHGSQTTIDQYGSYDRNFVPPDGRSTLHVDKETDNLDTTPDYSPQADDSPFTANISAGGTQSPEGQGPKFDGQAQSLKPGETSSETSTPQKESTDKAYENSQKASALLDQYQDITAEDQRNIESSFDSPQSETGLQYLALNEDDLPKTDAIPPVALPDNPTSPPINVSIGKLVEILALKMSPEAFGPLVETYRVILQTNPNLSPLEFLAQVDRFRNGRKLDQMSLSDIITFSQHMASEYGISVTQFWKGYFIDAPAEMVTGVLQMGLHPIQTIKGIYQLATMLGTDPMSVFKAIYDDAVEQASTRAGQGKIFFDIVTSLLTGGSNQAVGKAGKVRQLLQKFAPDNAIVKNFDNAIAKFSQHVTELADQLRTMCFARDTLVSTQSGLKPIGSIEIGDQVQSFDFESGAWKLRKVTDRIDSIYEGPVIRIQAGESTIEATIHHPFWVVRGHELSLRPTPRDFAEDEDQGSMQQGRWVNSHELLVGDKLIAQDGTEHTIERISQRYERAFPVSNLTIGDFHNYAVGLNSFLVHNESICSEGEKWLRGLLEEGTETLDTIKEFAKDFDNADEVIKRLVAPIKAITSAAQKKGDDFFKGFAKRNPTNQTTKQIGDFTEFAVDVAGNNGKSFTRWVKVVSPDGRTIQLYHDTFDNTGRFLNRGFKVPGPERHIFPGGEVTFP